MILKQTKSISAVVLVSFTLSACATGQEGVGQMLGALAVGGLCFALVDRNHKEACLAAAVAGFAVGGLIGRKMDERDRARRNQALNDALNDEALWAPRQGNGPLPATAVNGTPAPTAPPTRSAITPRRSDWVNPDTKNAGTIEAIQAYTGGHGGDKQCRQYRETYWKQGEPTVEVKSVCRDAKGNWA